MQNTTRQRIVNKMFERSELYRTAYENFKNGESNNEIKSLYDMIKHIKKELDLNKNTLSNPDAICANIRCSECIFNGILEDCNLLGDEEDILNKDIVMLLEMYIDILEGKEVQDITKEEEETGDIEKEIKELEERLNTLKELKNIQERAKELGYKLVKIKVDK